LYLTSKVMRQKVYLAETHLSLSTKIEGLLNADIRSDKEVHCAKA
jgi:hypothetical protein